VTVFVRVAHVVCGPSAAQLGPPVPVGSRRHRLPAHDYSGRQAPARCAVATHPAAAVAFPSRAVTL